MSKPFVINPWMLDQADRLIAYSIAHGLPLPSRSEWGLLEGFRRAEQDVDRTPGNWLDGWHPHSLLALQKAKDSRLERTRLPEVDLGKLPDSSIVSMHSFERDASGHLDRKLAGALIDARQDGRQGWIKISSELPPHLCMEASLRIGASWWCEPPEEKAQWEAYCLSQAQWSEVILRSAQWDQMVWPWSCMIEQGLLLCLRGKKPMASRFSAPAGWKDRRAAAWGGLGMRAWQSSVEIVEGAWEDIWIGILCDRLFPGSPSCD